MIKKLELKNFKRHERFETEFHPGSNVIVGANFSGKSSLLDAIAFALYGPAAVRGGMELCRRRGSERTSVGLLLDLDGAEYRIHRSSSTASMVDGDGSLVATGAGNVTGFCTRILGMDKKRFQKLRMVRQKKAEALLEAGTTDLHTMIEEVANVGIVSEALQLLSGLASDANAVLTNIEAEDVSEIEAALHEANDSVKELEDFLITRTDKLADAETKRFQALELMKAAEQYNREVDMARRRLADLGAVARDSQRECDKAYDWLTDHSEQYPQLEQDLKSAVAERDELQLAWKMCKERDEAWDKADRRVQDLTKAKDRAKSRIDQLNYQAADAGILFESKQHEADLCEELERRIELKADYEKKYVLEDRRERELEFWLRDSVCPTCHRAFEGAGYDPEAVASEKELVTERKAGMSDKVRELSKTIDDLQEFKQNANNAMAEINRLSIAYNELKTQVESAEADLGALEPPKEFDDTTVSRLKFLNTTIKSLERQATLRLSKQEMLKVLNDKRDRAESDSAEFQQSNPMAGAVPHSPEAMQEHANHVAVAEATLRQLSENVNDCKVSIAKKIAEKEGLANQLEGALKIKNKVDRFQRQKDETQALSKHLRNGRDTFVADVWQGITGWASQFAQGCTDGAIEGLIRQDGEFVYYEDGTPCPVAGASGAQASIMGLGLQIALCQALPSNFHTLMLDEPTADMTPDVSLSAMTLLKSLGNQIITVSHRELDGSVADNLIQM